MWAFRLKVVWESASKLDTAQLPTLSVQAVTMDADVVVLATALATALAGATIHGQHQAKNASTVRSAAEK
jgi:hypothetical protein